MFLLHFIYFLFSFISKLKNSNTQKNVVNQYADDDGWWMIKGSGGKWLGERRRILSQTPFFFFHKKYHILYRAIFVLVFLFIRDEKGLHTLFVFFLGIVSKVQNFIIFCIRFYKSKQCLCLCFILLFLYFLCNLWNLIEISSSRYK